MPPANTNPGMEMSGQPMPNMGQPGIPQPQQQPGMPPQMPGMPHQPMAAQQRGPQTPEQKYAAATLRILPSCIERNPYLKESVGTAIFEFVNMFVPQDKAPKITGMLIELPIDQIKQYLSDFGMFQAKVKEAVTLIE